MTSATIGRQSAASCLNRLQRPFDAASARCRQTEDYLAGGGSRTEAEAARRAAHTAVALRAGPLRRKIELLGQRGPPAAGGAGWSAVPSEGSTLSGCVARADRRAEMLALLLRPHHQVMPARPVTCTTRGPPGWADSSPDDTPGHVRSGLDP